jgi:nucleoid DNA-binding protein
MRKAEIVQRIAQELECTTAKAEAVVEAILTTIKASLPIVSGTILAEEASGDRAIG